MSVNHFTRIDGAKIRFGKIGKGKPVIILHGFPLPLTASHILIRTLKKTFTCYFPDLPGFGKSEKLTSEHTIENYAQFVFHFAKKLKLEKFSLIGFSLGGMISLKYAVKHQEHLEKVVICGACASSGKLLRRTKITVKAALVSFKKLPFTEKIIKKGFGNQKIIRAIWTLLEANPKDTSNTVKKTAEEISKTDLQVAAELGNDILKMKFLSDCEKIKTPALFLAGEKDGLIPPKAVKETFLKLPKAKFLLARGVKHSHIINSKTAKVIEKFLQKK